MTFLLAGCFGSPDKVAVYKWMKESMEPCGGQVKRNMILIREGIFSNKFVGYVEVVVNGRTYYPNLVVYADDKNEFYNYQGDPCTLEKLR